MKDFTTAYRKVTLTGGSYRISIPKEFRQAMGLVHRDTVAMTVKDGILFVEKATPSFTARRLK